MGRGRMRMGRGEVYGKGRGKGIQETEEDTTGRLGQSFLALIRFISLFKDCRITLQNKTSNKEEKTILCSF